MSFLRRLMSRRASGQSMVEFALAVPIFLLLVLGVVDLGRGFFSYAQLSNSVREGARVATFNQSTSVIRDTVKTKAPTLGLTDANITVTCYSGFTATTKACGSVAIGDGVKVSASLPFRPLTTRITSITGSPITISQSAMRAVQ
jgi:Flp pilus assembly protein TadG